MVDLLVALSSLGYPCQSYSISVTYLGEMMRHDKVQRTQSHLLNETSLTSVHSND